MTWAASRPASGTHTPRPVDALLHYINQRARRMVTGNVQASLHLLDQIENAVNTIQGHLVAERRERELKDQRMCGY